MNESTSVSFNLAAQICKRLEVLTTNIVVLQKVLNAVYQETVVELEECDVYDGATISEERETCNQTLARLQRWASDAEVTGRHDHATKLMMGRVNSALDHRQNDAELERIAGVWMDLALFHLRYA